MPTTTGFVLPTAQSSDVLSSTAWSQQANALVNSDTEAIEAITAMNIPASGSTSTGWLKLGNFNLDGLIPSNASILKVEIQVRWRVNSTAGVANREMCYAISGTRGTNVHGLATEPTTLETILTDVTAERTWTRANLLNGAFEVHVRGRNGNNATDPSYRIAWVKVQVTWDIPATPTYTDSYDDFTRADGPVYSGVDFWETNRLDWSTPTNARVISNRLGLLSAAYEQALSKQIMGPADYDLIFDCLATPTSPQEIAIWFNMTNTGDQSATMAGYALIITSTTWSVRKFVNGANTGNIVAPIAAATVIANDSVWIAKRGNVYTVYRDRAGGGFFEILNFTDTASPSGKFAIEMSDATVRWDNVRGGPFAPPVPLYETLIDDFNRADGYIHVGAGADRWTGRSPEADQISSAVTAPNIRSNQMASILGKNYFSTSKFMLAQNFDLLIDLPVVGTTYVDKLTLEFCEAGLGATTYTGYRLEVQAVTNPWKLSKHYDMGGGNYAWSMILNSNAPIVADGDSVWIRKRDTKISILRRPSGGEWASVLEVTDATFNRSGYITVWAHHDNAGRFDNLRGGPILHTLDVADSVTLSDSPALDIVIPVNFADSVTLSDELILADFTPVAIANCVGWFDASDLGIAHDSPVSAWPNKAPGGFGLTLQAPAPVARRNEFGMNGLPVVRFAGQTSGFYSLASGVGNEFTVVYVARMYGTTKGRVLGAAGGANNFLIGWHGGDWDVAYMEGWLDGFSGPNPTGTTPKLYSADGTGAFAGRLFSDGTQIRGPSGGTGGFNNTFGLSGAVFSLQGSDVDIAEIAIYNRKLSDVERQQVEAFLRAKWITPGAALTLDVSDSVTTSDSLDFQDETLIDDFNRTDGLVFVGTGASIWNPISLRGGAQTTMHIAGNVLGVANASDQTNNCYTLASLKSDFDLRVDCPVVSSLATEIYFGITDLGGGIWGGYSLVSYSGNPNDQWFIRKYTNVAARTFTVIGTTPSMPTLAANDSLWISKRGSQITAYKKSGTGPWTMLVTATDSTYGAGPMGFDQTDYRSWDNLRGGPFIPAIFASDSVTLSDALSLDWAINVADSVTLTDNLTLQDFSPSVVPGCTHWLDAEDDSSFTFSSGVLVSQWADKSGNVRHFTQATPGNQPSRTTPENGRNGRPVIAFDGVRYMLRSGAAPFTNVSATIFIVCVETGVHRDYAGFLAAMVAAGNDYDQVNGFDLNNGAVSPNQQFLADRASLGGVISGAAPTPFAVYTITYAPGTVTPHKNGVAGIAGGATAGGTPPGLCLGSRWLGGVVDLNYGMRGQIAELIIYDRVLNSAEQQQLEAYLTTKWLIAGTAHTLNIADNVTVNDSPAFVQDQTLVSADTVTLSDSLLREQDLVLNPVDSVTTSDSATFILDISLFVTEDVVLTDNVIWAQTFQLFLVESDSITVTDLDNLVFAFVVNSTDAVVLTDMLEIQVGLYFMSAVVLSDAITWEQMSQQVVVTVI